MSRSNGMPYLIILQENTLLYRRRVFSVSTKTIPHRWAKCITGQLLPLKSFIFSIYSIHNAQTPPPKKKKKKESTSTILKMALNAWQWQALLRQPFSFLHPCRTLPVRYFYAKSNWNVDAGNIIEIPNARSPRKNFAMPVVEGDRISVYCLVGQ